MLDWVLAPAATQACGIQCRLLLCEDAVTGPLTSNCPALQRLSCTPGSMRHLVSSAVCQGDIKCRLLVVLLRSFQGLELLCHVLLDCFSSQNLCKMSSSR